MIQNAGPVSTNWSIDPEPLVEIGSTGSREYELFRVSDAARLSDGTLVVGNGGTDEVRWYDQTGRFIRAAGRGGRGPGEFLLLGPIYVLPGDSIAVGDAGQQRVSIFDPAGQLARTTRYDDESNLLGIVGVLRDGDYLLTSTGTWLTAEPPVRIERELADVLRWAEGAGGPVVVARLPGTEVLISPSGGVRPGMYGKGPRDFGRNLALAATADGWVSGDSDRPELVYRDLSGRVTGIARWAHDPRPVTEQDVRAARERRLLNRQDDADVRRRLEAVWATHPPPPATMPVFSHFITDSEWNVWVKDYAPLGGEDSNTFRVFDSRGIWQSTVVAPEGLRIVWIGADRVLGVSVGELGVERVSVHELRRSDPGR